MKKLIMMLMILFTTSAFAQEHLQFYEIPLEGTIDSFTAELAQKGVKKDLLANLLQSKGMMKYNGKFAGYKTNEIIVYYNKKSQNVYKARVEIVNKKAKKIKETFSRINTLLTKKYPDAKYTDKDDKKFPSRTYYMTDAEGNEIGTIIVSTRQQVEKPYKYEIDLDYEDKASSALYYAEEAENL